MGYNNNWTLHKKILNFCLVPGHSGEVIGRHIEKCLNEWNIRRILTITVDNVSSNELVVAYLKRRITHWGGSVLDGKYLHMRCASHILNLVVKDGLKNLDLSIAKIRDAVKFMRSSPARLEKFKACIQEENIESSSIVCLDIETRWNSTLLMLESAIKFKNAFENLSTKDGAYCKELKKHVGIPDDHDWKRVKVFVLFLQIFYEATLKMSWSLYVTRNNFVPQIYEVGFLISTYCEDEDESIRKMASQMKAKHYKYWANVDNVNVLLFIALLLDPRHKWNFVDWVVKDTYDAENANELCSTIKVALKTLFEFYGNVVTCPKRKKQESVGTPSSTPTSVHEQRQKN